MTERPRFQPSASEPRHDEPTATPPAWEPLVEPDAEPVRARKSPGMNIAFALIGTVFILAMWWVFLRTGA